MDRVVLLDNLRRGAVLLAAIFLGGVQTADAKAALTVFDVPNAAGTFPLAIGDGGSIAGYWQDASFLDHGFVRA